MPFKTDKHKLDSPFFDKRVKLLPCQKEMVKLLHSQGMSINGLAKQYDVNKRLIQFILFPERLEKNLKDRAARGGSSIYYVREIHNEQMKVHRRYKHNLLTDICTNL